MDTMNQAPTTPLPPIPPGGYTPPSMNAPKSSIGSVIATIVIIIIIILGALYFWGKRIETQQANQAMIQSAGTSTEMSAAATEATHIQTVSQDDSLQTIQSENKMTNATNLSGELSTQ